MNTEHPAPAQIHSAFMPIIGTGSAFVVLMGLTNAAAGAAAMMS